MSQNTQQPSGTLLLPNPPAAQGTHTGLRSRLRSRRRSRRDRGGQERAVKPRKDSASAEGRGGGSRPPEERNPPQQSHAVPRSGGRGPSRREPREESPGRTQPSENSAQRQKRGLWRRMRPSGENPAQKTAVSSPAPEGLQESAQTRGATTRTSFCCCGRETDQDNQRGQGEAQSHARGSVCACVRVSSLAGTRGQEAG